MRQVLCLAVAAFFAHASAVRADSRLWFGSLNFESPRLVVPVLLVVATDAEGNEWSAGVTGWTLGAERKRAIDDRRKRQYFVRVTPINAQSSNYIYHDGKRDAAAEFGASSIELGGGLEVAHRPGWTGAYRVIAVYNAVSDVSPELAAFWNRPFAGLEIAQTYTRISSDELFGSRWEGVKIGGTLQVLTGANTWSRLQVRAGAGRRAGPLMASARVAAFTGRALNTVSAFLIGGSWDLAAPELFVGYRYSEFRLNSGATLGGALDIRVHGPWEVGVRGGYLSGSGAEEYSAAVQLMTVWRGAVLNAGAAFPKASLRNGSTNGVVIFGTVSAAVLKQ